MDKEQREHEAAMKKEESEKRESGNNRNSSGKAKNQSATGSSVQKEGKDSSSKTFNSGGNDSDYDGGHPQDASLDSDGRMNSNSTNSKEN